MESETTPGILGSASLVFTEDEFIAAWRAGRIARSRFYDRRSSRLVLAMLGLVYLLAGAGVVVSWLAGTRWENEPVPGAGVVLFAGIAALGAWMLYRLYSYRRRMSKAYRESPHRDDVFEYRFTPSRLIHHGRHSEGELDWSLAQEVAEPRDGFLIIWYPGTVGTFIPKHALLAPFASEDLANLLRSRVKKYRVIHRDAALPRS